MKFLFDEECVLKLQGEEVTCVAYRHVVRGSTFVKYVKTESPTRELFRESLEEALARKAAKYGVTLITPENTERYCSKSYNGIGCNGSILRSDTVVGQNYIGICSECGAVVMNYHTSSAVVPNEKKLKHIQNMIDFDNSRLSMTYNKITTIAELKNRLIELSPSVITQVELGRAVIGIQLANPKLSYNAIASVTGLRESRMSSAVRALRYPIEVQDLILDNKITMTVSDSLTPICEYPREVVINLFNRVIEDKLIFSEARALGTVLQSITDMVTKNNIDCTEEQLCAMYNRAINPVKVKPEDPDNVANTIIESVLGVINEVPLALVPTQVQTAAHFKNLSVKPQPYYLKRKQADFTKALSGYKDAVVDLVRTDKGFVVDVVCKDNDIPCILTAMYGATPLEDEVYSDSTVDIENQTVQILNSDFSCVDYSTATALINKIRSNTDIIAYNIQPSNAKQMTSYTLKGNSIYHIISTVLFDIQEQVHVVCLDTDNKQIKSVID